MNWFLKLGIRKKTLVLMQGIFLTAVIICGGIAFGIYKYSSNQMLKETVLRVSEIKQNELKNYFQQVDEVGYNVAYSKWVQNVFVAEKTNRNLQTAMSNVVDNMSSLSFLYADIRFVVKTVSGAQVVESGITDYDKQFQIEEQSWYEELLSDGIYVLMGEEQPYTKQWEEFITVCYVINDYNSLDMAGYLLLRIPVKIIGKLLDAIASEGVRMSLRIKGQTVGVIEELTETDIEMLSEESVILKQSGLYANRIPIEIHNLQMELVTVVNGTEIQVQNPIIWIVCLVVIFLIGMLLIGVSAVVSRYLTAPILKCKEAMQEIENDHLGVTIDKHYQDEIGELIEGFNRMSGSISQLIDTNKNISILQKEAEFKILERQLSPHFLFNTLEMINGMILSGHQREAVSACENLGQLYSYSLRQEKWVTIREELEYTRQYLTLMKYKMERLETDYEIDEHVLAVKTVKAILQPLVENSIRHGFRGQEKECCISIRIGEEQGQVHIAVMDNGKGMTDEQRQALNWNLQEIREQPGKKLPESAHVGVRNVFQRLYLEYGNQLQFSIASKKYYGVRIEIRIPGGKTDV